MTKPKGITVEIEVSGEQIADLMISAIEGNFMSRAWCAGINLEVPNGRGLASPWYSDPKLYAGAFRLEVLEIVDESKEPEGDNLRRHQIGRLDLQRGLHLMATKHPKHFSDFLREDGDAVTSDVFLQLVALGELTYG